MALVLPLVVAVALLVVLLLLVVVVVVAAAPGLPAAAADPGCFPSCALLDRIDHKPL